MSLGTPLDGRQRTTREASTRKLISSSLVIDAFYSGLGYMCRAFGVAA